MSSINPVPSTHRRAGPKAGFNGYHKLAGQGAGIVTVAGAPASRPVWIYSARSRFPVYATQSNSDGTWEVLNIANEPYTIIAFDNQGQFNAVIRDNITPVPMT